MMTMTMLMLMLMLMLMMTMLLMMMTMRLTLEQLGAGQWGSLGRFPRHPPRGSPSYAPLA
eukprot:4734732-Pyramimonas_sp.AAC.1